MATKVKQTFQEHWLTQHQRGLKAAHRKLLVAFRDLDWIHTHAEQDDVYKASNLYEEAMGYVLTDDDEDERDMSQWMEVFDRSWRWRWMEVFDRTWRRQMRANLLEVFDTALREAFTAIGKPWPGPEEQKPEDKTPIARRPTLRRVA